MQHFYLWIKEISWRKNIFVLKKNSSLQHAFPHAPQSNLSQSGATHESELFIKTQAIAKANKMQDELFIL